MLKYTISQIHNFIFSVEQVKFTTPPQQYCLLVCTIISYLPMLIVYCLDWSSYDIVTKMTLSTSLMLQLKSLCTGCRAIMGRTQSNFKKKPKQKKKALDTIPPCVLLFLHHAWGLNYAWCTVEDSPLFDNAYLNFVSKPLLLMWSIKNVWQCR